MNAKPVHVTRMIAALATLLAVTACGALTTPKVAADVHVTSPLPNSEIAVGVSTFIKADVTGDNIARVDVQVDGQPYAILTTDDKAKGLSSFPVSVPWTPSSAGIHIVQLLVYGPDAKLLTKSDPVIFTATASAGAVEKTAAPTETPAVVAAIVVTKVVPLTNTLALPTPTLGAVVIVITVTATPANAVLTGPALTVNSDSVNVRSGPGTQYVVIGQLLNGANVSISGKSSDGAWWQVAYADVPGGIGWVRSDLVQANSAAAAVPVVTAPPLPTYPPYTPTPTQPAATPTPAERACNSSMVEWIGSDARYPFCVAKVMTWNDNQDGAHRYENGHDVPLSFSWDIWGVDSIWIVFEQDNSGYCGYTKTAVKTINEQVKTGYYAFNVKDFPGGATMRIFLSIRRKDGQVVQYGDKRLCIF